MRWVKSTVFPIALISMVISGYSLTAIHLIETERDTQFNELLNQFTKLKVDLSKAGRGDVPRMIDRTLAADGAARLSSPSELALLRKELNEMRNQQTRFQHTLDSLLSTSNLGDDADEYPESTEIENSSVAEAETLKLETDFESESVDLTWGGSAELQIQSAIDEISPKGVYFKSTECRSTVCRIDVEFDDAKSKLEETSFLPMLIPWSGESYFHTDPASDGNAVVLYVAREGFSLAGEAQQVQDD